MISRRSLIQDELKQRRPFANRREELFVALLRTAAVARRPVARVIEAHGISMAQYNVLRILRGSGRDGLPTLTIRERMIEEAAGITRLIDKLEASGLARRDRTASADRRRVFCRITEAGLSLLESLEAPVIAATDASLATLDEDACERLLMLLDDLRRGHHRPRGALALVGDEDGEPEGDEGSE